LSERIKLLTITCKKYSRRYAKFLQSKRGIKHSKKKKKKLIKGLEKEMARDATGIAKKLQECPVLVTKLKI
jgi:hypothetical protein